MKPQKSGSSQLDLRNVPSWDEVRKLVFSSKTFLKKEYWLYLALVAFTGARRNEIWNLTTDDMIWENDEITAIRIKQLKKQEDMWREVPVTEQIRSELSDFVKEERRNGEKIFSFSQRMCNYIFNRAREKVLGKDFRLHDLRHAFAFRMLEKTQNLEKVRRLLGHSGYDYLKTYLESSQRDLEPELEAAIAGRK